MKNALSSRLQQARERLFVGREAQLAEFERALECEVWPRAVWHVHGLGGIGKTSLLRCWKRQAQDAGALVINLDARDFEPNVSAFSGALRVAISEGLNLQSAAPSTLNDLCEALASAPCRVVLQIDTLEILAPLDYFLREKFVPLLPENAILMLAGRNELSLGWRGDAALWDEVVSFNLAALSPLESESYLRKRGIATAFQPQFLEWTHGHPLSLSLAADVWQQRAGTLGESGGEEAPGVLDKPDDLPQLVGPLLEHLMREVPTPAHRAALEACAIVRAMTQELLAEMLEGLPGAQGDSRLDFGALFEWLRGLSIMQSHRFGVFPHDIARELLVADLRFRTPDWHGELHRRARAHYLNQIHSERGAAQERAIINCIYLHRLSPVIGPYLYWSDTGFWIDGAKPEDFPTILAMVEKHEGAPARAIAKKCLDEQPGGAIVVRHSGGEVQGFVFQLALERVSNGLRVLDPGTRRASEWIQRQAPLREGDLATLFRFWMDKDTYQEVGTVQSLIFVQAVRYYITTPHLAFTFFPCSEPDFWEGGFAYADLGRVVDADFALDGRAFGMFGHDWRARPVLSWFDLLSQREMQTVAPVSAPAMAAGEVYSVLGDEELLAATQAALRSGGEVTALRRNPLLETALVAGCARQMGTLSAVPSPDERVLALRWLLREAIASVANAPRSAKNYRALELTFGRRTLTQEAAAAVMDVSHSSLRRYLSAGIAQVAAWLREREAVRDETKVSKAPIIQNEQELTWF